MKFLEKDLESIIFEEPESAWRRGLHNLDTSGKIKRQVRLMPYGIADLVSITCLDLSDVGIFKKYLQVQIIECKRDVVNIATLMQSKRYEHAIRMILTSACPGVDFEYKHLLVGRKVNWSDGLEYAIAWDHNISVYSYEYKSDGIEFVNEMPIERLSIMPANSNKHPVLLTALESIKNPVQL